MILVALLWIVLFATLRNAWRRRAAFPFTVTGLVGSALTACLVLVVASATWLWHRSGRVVDEVVFGVSGAHHEIASYRGGVQYVVVSNWHWDARPRYGTFAPTEPMRRPRPVPLPLRPSMAYARLNGAPSEDVWDLGGYVLTPRGERLGIMWGAGTEQPLFAKAPLRYQVLRIPYAWIVSLAAIVPLMRLPPWLRRWRRLRNGRCPRCGYDLRVTPGACPECGWRRRSEGVGAPTAPASTPLVQSV